MADTPEPTLAQRHGVTLPEPTDPEFREKLARMSLMGNPMYWFARQCIALGLRRAVEIARQMADERSKESKPNLCLRQLADAIEAEAKRE